MIRLLVLQQSVSITFNYNYYCNLLVLPKHTVLALT